MEVNITEMKDGDKAQQFLGEAPSNVVVPKPKTDASVKKKRRRGKSKRKIISFMKTPWQDKRKNDKSKRNNRFRKIVLAKTHAPFNNNQFLMEIHKPEPENTFNKTPARTRDSSFSVDSEENYFFSLPEDEEEYLTKEFSSVYEDAQCERLSNMSKNELIQEYLLLEAKYENLLKRTERSKPRFIEEDTDNVTERDTSTSDRDSTMTDRDASGTFNESTIVSVPNNASIETLMRHAKDQETQLRELQVTNEQLRIENEALRQRVNDSSSEDSESDSSTSSGSSSSSKSMSPKPELVVEMKEDLDVEVEQCNGQNTEPEDTDTPHPLVNGYINSD